MLGGVDEAADLYNVSGGDAATAGSGVDNWNFILSSPVLHVCNVALESDVDELKLLLLSYERFFFFSEPNVCSCRTGWHYRLAGNRSVKQMQTRFVADPRCSAAFAWAPNFEFSTLGIFTCRSLEDNIWGHPKMMSRKFFTFLDPSPLSCSHAIYQ